MNKQQFIDKTIKVAKKQGYSVRSNRDGLDQIDFGHKQLHTRHLEAMFPEILEEDMNIGKVIDRVAPGRPCAHRPMKDIIKQLKKD